jgi:hypothetical protein
MIHSFKKSTRLGESRVRRRRNGRGMGRKPPPVRRWILQRAADGAEHGALLATQAGDHRVLACGDGTNIDAQTGQCPADLLPHGDSRSCVWLGRVLLRRFAVQGR